MKKVYINSLAAISSQKTYDNHEFLEEILPYTSNILPVEHPVYKDYISPVAARRMAKGIKMGVVASKIALKEAGLETVDAIITGTGMGCLVDSEKFVSGIIDNHEQYLTPTAFIQSTHNTVAGQIALGMECKAYNFTYVHSAVSFESALLDAKMQLESDEAENILIGGIDELAAHTTEVHRIIDHLKTEAVSNTAILDSKTKGAVFGEGASFFVVSNKKNKESYAEVVDLETYNTLSKENVSDKILEFLKGNDLEVSDLDLVVLGNNGDVEFDEYYKNLMDWIFENISQAYYKHLSGEYCTSSAFGFWMASKILKSQSIPEIAKLNEISTSEVNHVLLYNQYRGENHSLILLKRC